MPGPEVQVKAREPFHEAPITDADRGQFVLGLDDGVARAVGAGLVAQLLAMMREGVATPEEGVIGYQAQTVAPP